MDDEIDREKERLQETRTETIREQECQRKSNYLEYIASIPGSGKDRAFAQCRKYGGIWLIRDLQ